MYFRGSLDKEGGQVQWDYSAETTNSLKEMVKVFTERLAKVKQTNTE